MATDYAARQAAEQKRREQMVTLCQEIAGFLPAWELALDDDYDKSHTFTCGELKFRISWDRSAKADRVNIQTWHWPRYKFSFEHGEWQKSTQSPNNLRDPAEVSPGISCAMDRGAEAIANDIKRKFLPEYARIYARCAERAAAYEVDALARHAAWEKVCSVLKADPNHNHHYVSNFSIENRGGKAHLVGDVTAEQLEKILNLLKSL